MAATACRATPAELRATDPPSLRVRVAAGDCTGPDGGTIAVVATELAFDPPAVGQAASTGPIPGNHNPAVSDAEQMKGWNAFAPLPPENPAILGYFHRGIPAESLVLKNHDGTKTFERGVDYVFNTELGQVLAIKGGLGKKAVDSKKPAPEETLRAEFAYYQQRLDLVQVDSAGRATVKKGASVIMCPQLPSPDRGCVALAGVWVYGAHGTGPVPAKPEQVAIAQADICMIRPAPPVAPVNPQALSKAVTKLKTGKPIGVAFFGDSIAVGAETPDWYFHIYSPRNTGFVGMVIRDLRSRYPQGDVQATWGIAGAQSIFNEPMFQNTLSRAAAPQGGCVWWEAEGADDPVGPEELTLKDPEEKRVLSAGRWRILSPKQSVQYTVDVPEGGPWHLFVRHTLKQGLIKWRWDDGQWMTEQKEQKPTDADDVRRGLALCWFNFGRVDLKPGKRQLTVEAIDAPTAIDCFALSGDERGPWRKHRPSELTIDVLVYAMGMNGAFNEKTPREKHKETILRHIQEARQRGTEVLLVSTMENNVRLQQRDGGGKKPNRDLMAEIAAETGCAFADVYTEWMNQETRGIPPESRLHNFINHPDIVGHRLWADVILRCFDAADGTEAARTAR